MGGGASTYDIEQARNAQGTMENELFALAEPALKSGTGYLMGEMGGKRLDETAKYSAMGTDVLEASATPEMAGGNLFDMAGGAERQAARRAIGTVGVGAGKLLSGVDEFNRIRSLLGNSGLKTTSLAASSGAQSIEALSMLPRHTTASLIEGGLAAGASAYGAYEGSQRPQTTTIAPVSSGAFAGSDISMLYGGAGSSPASGWLGQPYSFNMGS